MKEFEKWFNNFDCDTIDCGGIGCNTTCKEIRKETWRAALEWVKEEICECLSPQEAIELINEEFEDERV